MKSTDFLVHLTTSDDSKRTYAWSDIRVIGLHRHEVTVWIGDDEDAPPLVVSEQYDELCGAWNDYLEMVFKAQFPQAFGG